MAKSEITDCKPQCCKTSFVNPEILISDPGYDSIPRQYFNSLLSQCSDDVLDWLVNYVDKNNLQKNQVGTAATLGAGLTGVIFFVIDRMRPLHGKKPFSQIISCN